MIIFERTRDWETIKAIITHPDVYPFVSDDGSPNPDAFEPLKDDGIWYVLVKEGGEILGLWTLIPENKACWKVHTCLLPGARGPKAREAVKEFAPWVWRNIPCFRVITDVPEYNRAALKFAQDAGMKEYGINEKSYLKNGVLHNQILLGISKPCQ